MGGAQVAGTSSSPSDIMMGGAASEGNFKELDKLLSQQFEEQQSSTKEITLSRTHFAAAKSVEKILQMRQNAVPIKSR